MAKIDRTIMINAPVEKVFEYLVLPTNLPEIWPSLIEVKDVKQTPQHVGDSWRWAYKMAGVRFEGETKTEEYIPNKRIVTKSTGSIPSKYVYTFEKENGHTHLREEVEYAVPDPLLVKFKERFVLKVNEDETDAFLANLKARLEI